MLKRITQECIHLDTPLTDATTGATIVFDGGVINPDLLGQEARNFGGALLHRAAQSVCILKGILACLDVGEVSDTKFEEMAKEQLLHFLNCRKQYAEIVLAKAKRAA